MDWNDFISGYVFGSALTLLLIIIGLPWRVEEDD